MASVGLYDNDYTSWSGPNAMYVCSDARRNELVASGGWEGAWAFWDYDVELAAPGPEEHPEWGGAGGPVLRMCFLVVRDAYDRIGGGASPQ